MLYIVILRSTMFGIFNSKKHMRIAIEDHIKFEKEKSGTPVGNLHFRYFTMNPNEPFFSNNGEYKPEVGSPLFSFSTMHSEYFPHEVETDWSTGEITKL